MRTFYQHDLLIANCNEQMMLQEVASNPSPICLSSIKYADLFGCFSFDQQTVTSFFFSDCTVLLLTYIIILQEVRLPPSKVWVPDIVLFNDAEGQFIKRKNTVPTKTILEHSHSFFDFCKFCYLFFILFTCFLAFQLGRMLDICNF
jgi:hypothetical protein